MVLEGSSWNVQMESVQSLSNMNVLQKLPGNLQILFIPVIVFERKLCPDVGTERLTETSGLIPYYHVLL